MCFDAKVTNKFRYFLIYSVGIIANASIYVVSHPYPKAQCKKFRCAYKDVDFIIEITTAELDLITTSDTARSIEYTGIERALWQYYIVPRVSLFELAVSHNGGQLYVVLLKRRVCSASAVRRTHSM